MEFYGKSLILYLMILLIAMLYPFDFDFRPNDAKWFDSKNGIHFQGKGLIISQASSFKLNEKLKKGRGLTLTVVVETDDSIQESPGRILSCSFDPNTSNFTLAQSRDRLVFRLRTEQTDSNGVLPRLTASHVFEPYVMTHIVITYNFYEQCLFINGKQRTCDKTIKGNFSNWGRTSHLVIGNEVNGARPWRGKIYYAAIYDQALGREEINEKFKHGIQGLALADTNPPGTHTDPIIRYRFSERRGKLVEDSGVGASNLHLIIPDRLPWAAAIFNFKKLSRPKNSFFSFNTLPHLFLFIPLGLLLYQFINLRLESLSKTVFIVLAIGFFVSLGFEILQHFLPSRNTSIKDVVVNLIGISVGIIIHKIYMKRV